MLSVLRQRNFALLWLAGLISTAGDFALVIALPLYIYQQTDSTLATAAIFAVRVVPSMLIGSFAGVFIDRWDRKRTMIWADLLRAGTVLLLLVATSDDLLVLVFVVASVQGTIGLFFSPAENALLPLLVDEEHLVTANALNALNDNIGRLIGPVIGAWLYASSGLNGAAIVEAASYAGSAALIALIVAPRSALQGGHHDAGVTASAQPAVRRALHEWRQGLAMVRRSRVLRIIFLAEGLGSISEGAFVTLAVAPFVLDVLGGTEAQVGWIGASQAIGGLIGGFVIGRYGKRMRRRLLVAGGMIGLGIADMSQFNARRVAPAGTPAVTVAMGCMLAAGFPVVAFAAGMQSAMQSLTEDRYRGRVFGALNALRSAALLVGLTLAGVLGDSVRIVPVLTACSALWLVAGAVVLIFLKEEDLHSSVRPATA